MSVEPDLRPARPGPSEAPTSPHPRMRERRVAVARSRGRRRLRRLNVVLALVALAVWSLVLLRSAALDVDRVAVEGAERTDRATVAAASDLDRGDPMVGADLDRARRQVAALPWVDEVRVTRSWPGTVTIAVTERVAVATVAHPDGWVVLDRRGRALDVQPTAPSDLVALDGERAVAVGGSLPAPDRAVVAVVAALPPGLRDATTEAGDGSDGIELALDDGFRVVLGDRSDLDAKAEAAEAVRQHADQAGGYCRIDVRVPSAPVLTTGRGCA